jgi:hypothetical protein
MLGVACLCWDSWLHCRAIIWKSVNITMPEQRPLLYTFISTSTNGCQASLQHSILAMP